ncbi:MAG TPA: NF038122 family metalloprotease [Micropepsaceae bacterium]|nr:NF038122 family metalloprotease [Micropepsaceae bacterium]
MAKPVSFSLDAITDKAINATDDDRQVGAALSSHDSNSAGLDNQSNGGDTQSPHAPSDALNTALANLDVPAPKSSAPDSSHGHDLSPFDIGPTSLPSGPAAPDVPWQVFPLFQPSSAPNTVLIDGDGNIVQSAGGGGHGSGSGGTTTSSTTVTGGAGTGLIINVTYDSSVGSAPAGFTNEVAQVVQFFESHFADPVTININVGYGEVGGTQLGGGALGESMTSLSSLSYSQLKSVLTADAKTAADSSAVASLPSSDPTGGAYWVSSAEAKALGYSSGGGTDGYVGFSSSAGIFDYNNTDGVSAGQYDFFAVVSHEISEVMGRILLAGGTIGTSANSYDALDLFHFSSSGVHDFSGSTPGYFSVDNGATSQNTFNTNPGGDYGDWAGASVDAFNAFGSPGVAEPVSSSDITALDAIGWDAQTASAPVAAPDLTISNLALNVAKAGVTVSFQVNDVGALDAPASTAGIYLSTDSTITTSDTLVGSVSTPALSAGTFVQEMSGALNLPTNLTPGTYYIGAYADAGLAVSESSEANNGLSSKPFILGNDSGNSINGTGGGDTILGLGGNDTLYGGGGADLLMGGAGNDHFVYKATTNGLDSIGDFTSGADVMDFARTAFGGRLALNNANTGILDPSHFVANDTGSTTLSQKFWFDTANHTLYYDSDGSGSGAAVAIAQFDSSVTLQSSDIHLI